MRRLTRGVSVSTTESTLARGRGLLSCAFCSCQSANAFSTFSAWEFDAKSFQV